MELMIIYVSKMSTESRARVASVCATREPRAFRTEIKSGKDLRIPKNSKGAPISCWYADKRGSLCWSASRYRYSRGGRNARIGAHVQAGWHVSPTGKSGK